MRLPKKWDDLILQDLKYNDGRLRLLLYLKNKGTDTPIFAAWVGDMARDLQVSAQSIRRWLKALIDRGYIKRAAGYCRYIIIR